MSKNSNDIKVLSDRDWLLIRGHNIIGSLQTVKQESFLLKGSCFQWTEYLYIPGLVKIINEIIDNSIDVAIKSNFKFANEININITPKRVKVQDNGYGIPVKKEGGHWLPEIAWGQARAGSNFEDDDKRVSAGMNGIGSFATTVFSKKFIGVTDDGEKRLRVEFKDNLSSTSITELKTETQGTAVLFEPDLERFGLKEIDDLHTSLIHQRIINLSVLYPEIRFKFNNRVVKYDPKKFIGLFNETFEIFSTDDFFMACVPNDSNDFRFHSYVNSLWLEKGGNHVEFLVRQLTGALREKLVRKFKSIKPGDIKNKLSCVIFFRNFPGAKFDGQTKEFLTNTQAEITGYLDFNSPEIKKKFLLFINRVYKNKNIIDPITDLYKAKMLVEESKALKKATKQQDLPEKFWPATDDPKRLFIAEGDTAITSIISRIGRSENGFFPLKGVILNVIKDSKKVLSNAEIKQLATILGLDLSKNDNENLVYDSIAIATDMDVDGDHIAGLVLGFIYKYFPKYLYEGKVFRFITPLITVYSGIGKIHSFIFSMQELEEFQAKNKKAGLIFDYKKGLGTLEKLEWKELFKRYTLDELLEPLHLKESENTEEEIAELIGWLSDDIAFRKRKISSAIDNFDINLI